jgi:hypothetical protein
VEDKRGQPMEGQREGPQKTKIKKEQITTITNNKRTVSLMFFLPCTEGRGGDTVGEGRVNQHKRNAGPPTVILKAIAAASALICTGDKKRKKTNIHEGRGCGWRARRSADVASRIHHLNYNFSVLPPPLNRLFATHIVVRARRATRKEERTPSATKDKIMKNRERDV